MPPSATFLKTIITKNDCIFQISKYIYFHIFQNILISDFWFSKYFPFPNDMMWRWKIVRKSKIENENIFWKSEMNIFFEIWKIYNHFFCAGAKRRRLLFETRVSKWSSVCLCAVKRNLAPKAPNSRIYIRVLKFHEIPWKCHS